MFKKKQKPEPTKRVVSTQKAPGVFSYYSSRSENASDSRVQRRSVGTSGTPNKASGSKKFSSAVLLDKAPAVTMLLVFVISFFYMSTLSAEPKLQIIGDENKSALADTETYQSELTSLLDSSPLNKSKLLINTSKVENQIKQEYPELGQISLVLPLVNRRPVIVATPEKPAIILSSQSGAFIVNQSGRIILDASSASSSLKSNIPVVQDQSNLELNLGGPAMPSESVQFIAEVNQQLVRAKIEPEAFILPTEANQLNVKIKTAPGQGYLVKFDMKGDARLQAGSLIATHKHLTAKGIQVKQYIDVRVEGRVFYK